MYNIYIYNIIHIYTCVCAFVCVCVQYGPTTNNAVTVTLML